MTSMHGFGLGIASKNTSGEILEVFYPQPLAHLSGAVASAIEGVSGELDDTSLAQLANALDQAGESGLAQIARQLINCQETVVATALTENAPPRDVSEAYLKLHLLSHRLVQPHGTQLEGIFPLLPNIAWTNQGAIDLRELPQRQLDARLRGEVIEVASVDKFPKMTNYVVPAGVRIAHTARVRLGAYLGEGTTVMHEGFINFNAGTEGPGMVEGRISAGVWVGAGSDLGGGCSTMGTLSGGGNIIISVGKECLIGANAGLGIPLGDRCTIEAGLFITAGTKVTVLDGARKPVDTVSARDLSNRSDLLFRRNSTSGTVECLTNRSAIELNETLHANN
jgi:2,3,4,5-tetrahydropyridine-2-carboxylate N-succinyltransferase